MAEKISEKDLEGRKDSMRRRARHTSRDARLMIDAKAMLEEDGLEPDRVARILKVTVEELAQLTGNAAGNAIM